MGAFGIKEQTPTARGVRQRAPTLLKSVITNAAASRVEPPANIQIPARPASNTKETIITTEGTALRLPTQSKPLSAASFKVGDIIKIPHLVPSLDTKAKAAERIECKLISSYICPKIRYAIVIGKYATRMLVLPVYSSDKKGVQNKPDEYKATALSVYNPQDPDPTAKAMLTADALITNGGRYWYAGSHVNLADTVSVSYNWGLEPGHGSLKEPDRKLLQRIRILQDSAEQSNQLAWFQKRVLEGKVKVRRAMQSTQSGVPGQVTTGFSARSAVGTAVTGGTWASRITAAH